MTHFSIWRYELASRTGTGRPRQGALLRVSFEQKYSGYADIHPWPELGDAPLESQLQGVAARSLTALARISLMCATVDGEARAQNRSLFGEETTIPRSHASMPGALNCDPEVLRDELVRAAERGFDRIKIKGSRWLESELPRLEKLARTARDLKLKVRIDFNGRLTVDEAASVLDQLRTMCDGLDWIDWIEDPCPFGVENWKRLRETFQVRVALDRDRPSGVKLGDAADVVVHKPAVEGLAMSSVQSFGGLSVCVTSYLDHPVGQMFAAVKACQLSKLVKLETCGLLTHEVYEPNPFSERLKTDGPVLIPPEGTGIGFDDLLENLPWEELE